MVVGVGIKRCGRLVGESLESVEAKRFCVSFSRSIRYKVLVFGE